jgi:hypothetical protein
MPACAGMTVGVHIAPESRHPSYAVILTASPSLRRRHPRHVVIPAQAGIQWVHLDARLRGHDGGVA